MYSLPSFGSTYIFNLKQIPKAAKIRKMPHSRMKFGPNFRQLRHPYIMLWDWKNATYIKLRRFYWKRKKSNWSSCNLNSVTPLPVLHFWLIRTQKGNSIRKFRSNYMKILLTVSVINLCFSSFQGEKVEHSSVNRSAVPPWAIRIFIPIWCAEGKGM